MSIQEVQTQTEGLHGVQTQRGVLQHSALTQSVVTCRLQQSVWLLLRTFVRSHSFTRCIRLLATLVALMARCTHGSLHAVRSSKTPSVTNTIYNKKSPAASYSPGTRYSTGSPAVFARIHKHVCNSTDSATPSLSQLTRSAYQEGLL